MIWDVFVLQLASLNRKFVTFGNLWIIYRDFVNDEVNIMKLFGFAGGLWYVHPSSVSGLYLTWSPFSMICTLRFNGHISKPVAYSILLLHLFLHCTSFWDRPKLSTSSLTQSHQVFFGRSLFYLTFNFPGYTTFDPVIIIFSFNMSKPSQPTVFDHQINWFQS